MLKFNFKNILIAIIIIILFCYFHPTKETISCDSNLTCKVNRQYIYLIDTNFKINLSYNSNIFIKPGKIWNIQRRPSRGRLITHYAHLQITDINGRKKQPFTNYYLAYRGKSFETPDKIALYETQYFKKYLMNPENGFILEAPCIGFSHVFIVAIVTIIFLSFVYFLYFIVNYFENKVKKIYRNLKKK